MSDAKDTRTATKEKEQFPQRNAIFDSEERVNPWSWNGDYHVDRRPDGLLEWTLYYRAPPMKRIPQTHDTPEAASAAGVKPDKVAWCEMCHNPGTKRCGDCRMAWYCSGECARIHWTAAGHKAECKRLRQYHAVMANDADAALGWTFEAWFESDRRAKHGHVDNGAVSIEHHRGDATRLVRRLSTAYPGFDFNNQSCTDSHPLVFIAACEPVPWRYEAFMAILSALGVNVLRPFSRDARKTVIEAVVEALGADDQDDRIAASLIDVTPPVVLTGLSVNCFRVSVSMGTDQHRCSILSELLRRYVVSGHGTLESLVRAFGVDSNGMNLTRTCERCRRRVGMPSIAWRNCWLKQRERHDMTLKAIEQLNTSLQRYRSELPIALVSIFDSPFLGAVTSLCALVASFL